MDQKTLEARRAYKRAWAKKNPEKIKAQQERYWAKKAAELEAQERTENENNTNIQAS